MKLNLYHCFAHGYTDAPDKFMGKMCCPYFVPPEGQCLFELVGPYPAEVDLPIDTASEGAE